MFVGKTTKNIQDVPKQVEKLNICVVEFCSEVVGDGLKLKLIIYGYNA